jgi:hypothetical protein
MLVFSNIRPGQSLECDDCGKRIFDGTDEMAATWKLDELCRGSVLDALLQAYMRDDPDTGLAHIQLAVFGS